MEGDTFPFPCRWKQGWSFLQCLAGEKEKERLIIHMILKLKIESCKEADMWSQLAKTLMKV